MKRYGFIFLFFFIFLGCLIVISKIKTNKINYIDADKITFITRDKAFSVNPLIIDNIIYIPFLKVLENLDFPMNNIEYNNDTMLVYLAHILSLTVNSNKAFSGLSGAIGDSEIELSANVIKQDEIIYVPIDLFADEDFLPFWLQFAPIELFFNERGKPTGCLLVPLRNAMPQTFTLPVPLKADRFISRQTDINFKYTLTCNIGSTRFTPQHDINSVEETVIIRKDGRNMMGANKFSGSFSEFLWSNPAKVKIGGLEANNVYGITDFEWSIPTGKKTPEHFGYYSIYIIENDYYVIESDIDISEKNYMLYEDGFSAQFRIQKNGVIIKEEVPCRLILNDKNFTLKSLDGNYFISSSHMR